MYGSSEVTVESLKCIVTLISSFWDKGTFIPNFMPLYLIDVELLQSGTKWYSNRMTLPFIELFCW